MRVIFRFVARLLGATLVTTVVLISLTTTAAAARTRGALVEGHALSPALDRNPGKIFIDLASAPRLQPAVDVQTSPWTVVAWLAAGLVIVAGAGVTLTLVGRLRAGRSGTSK